MRFLSQLIAVFILTIGYAFANVDVNSAGVSELSQFPGVGKVIAQRIIDYRTENGAFATCDDLIKVKGIGAKTMAKISPLCHIGDGKASPQKATAAKTSAPEGNGIDFNKATAAEIIQIKGIGKKMAARIIADRDEKGAFASCDDLLRIKGIGPAKLKAIKPHCKLVSNK